MSTGTKSTPLPLEAHDAPRVTPPAHVEAPAREAVCEPEALDVTLDNPYDNLACTD